MSKANLESKGKCLLKDATQEDQDQLTLFVKYFLKVPGYNSRDLTGQTLDLPENCQEHLQNKGGTSMDDLMSSPAEITMRASGFSQQWSLHIRSIAS